MSDNATRAEVLTFLKNNLVCVIATVDGNKPEAATVQFLADDNMNITFVTRRQTRKFKNLMANPNVAIVVGTELAPRTLQMEGTAELMDTSLANLSALAHRPGMSDIYRGAVEESPFLKMQGADYAVFKVTPQWIRWMNLDEEGKKEVYQQILPQE